MFFEDQQALFQLVSLYHILLISCMLNVSNTDWVIWSKSRLEITQNIILWEKFVCLIMDYPFNHLEMIESKEIGM